MLPHVKISNIPMFYVPHVCFPPDMVFNEGVVNNTEQIK